jgi:hypothetical protein
MMRPFRTARQSVCCMLATALFAAVAGCSDRVTQPTSLDGEYAVTVETPAGHVNGAALIELAGSGIAEVTAAGNLIWSDVDSAGARVLLIARTPGPLRFTLRLSGAHSVPIATVLQVSDADNQLRASLHGYVVRFWQ